MDAALEGITVVSLAVNVPGPVAAARLRQLGAAVVKIEPPDGDPLARACPTWYDALCQGQEVWRLDLKADAGRTELDTLLEGADLLLTAQRPAALARLGLAWPVLHARHPRLAQVAIGGYAAPHDEVPGHDLTYLAAVGLLTPPGLPRTLMVDLAGAERAVSAALGLLLARERGQQAGYAGVLLGTVAEALAEPLRHGLTAPGGILGGGLPGYGIYRAKEGWIAVAALERHFWRRLGEALGMDGDAGSDDLAAVFATRSADEWQCWAVEHDLPLASVSG
jgi:crotonobetainyl-CoA:carnitine CoA-transferase CaiB-like acyl-CoA transferase